MAEMLIIFDFDGVVADSMLLHCEVESEAYKKIGIEISPHELASRFAGISQSEVSRTLALETGRAVPDDFNSEALKKDIFTARLKPIPYIADALDRLTDYSICIASGSGLTTLDHCLSLIGLHDRFAPNIFSSEQVSKGKPAPDLFLYAANKMGFTPEQCLVVEDGVAGVQAAEAAGMTVLGFTGGCHCDETIAERLSVAGAETIFSDMHMLPNLADKYFKPKIRSAR